MAQTVDQRFSQRHLICFRGTRARQAQAEDLLGGALNRGGQRAASIATAKDMAQINGPTIMRSQSARGQSLCHEPEALKAVSHLLALDLQNPLDWLLAFTEDNDPSPTPVSGKALHGYPHPFGEIRIHHSGFVLRLVVR